MNVVSRSNWVCSVRIRCLFAKERNWSKDFFPQTKTCNHNDSDDDDYYGNKTKTKTNKESKKKKKIIIFIDTQEKNIQNYYIENISTMIM